MTHQPRWTLFAIVGWSLAVIGGVGGLMVRLVWPVPLLSTTFGIGPTAMVAIAALGVIWSTVGALLIIRRSENPVGRIMILAVMADLHRTVRSTLKPTLIGSWLRPSLRR